MTDQELRNAIIVLLKLGPQSGIELHDSLRPITRSRITAELNVMRALGLISRMPKTDDRWILGGFDAAKGGA